MTWVFQRRLGGGGGGCVVEDFIKPTLFDLKLKKNQNFAASYFIFLRSLRDIFNLEFS